MNSSPSNLMGYCSWAKKKKGLPSLLECLFCVNSVCCSPKFGFAEPIRDALRGAERERERETVNLHRPSSSPTTHTPPIHPQWVSFTPIHPSIRSTPISLQSTQNRSRPRPTQVRARSSSNAQSTGESSPLASSSPPFFLVQTQPETQKTHSSKPLQRTHHFDEPIPQTHFSKPPLAAADLSLSVT